MTEQAEEWFDEIGDLLDRDAREDIALGWGDPDELDDECEDDSE